MAPISRYDDASKQKELGKISQSSRVVQTHVNSPMYIILSSPHTLDQHVGPISLGVNRITYWSQGVASLPHKCQSPLPPDKQHLWLKGCLHNSEIYWPSFSSSALQYSGWLCLSDRLFRHSVLSVTNMIWAVGLVWGLAATRRSVCIHQVNRVNSRNDYVMMTAP